MNIKWCWLFWWCYRAPLMLILLYIVFVDISQRFYSYSARHSICRMKLNILSFFSNIFLNCKFNRTTKSISRCNSKNCDCRLFAVVVGFAAIAYIPLSCSVLFSQNFVQVFNEDIRQINDDCAIVNSSAKRLYMHDRFLANNIQIDIKVKQIDIRLYDWF